MLALASIVVASLVAEIGIRLSPFAKPQFISYDPQRGWALRGGASGWQRQEGRAWVGINRWGYRGPDWSLKKPPGTLRIIVVGDSFIEAPQVDESQTLCAVASRELARNCPFPCGQAKNSRIQVMNFGIDGYGTAQELLTVRRDAWKFAPDIVVLAFFAGNDFRNNSLALEGDRCRPFFTYRQGALVLDGPFDDSRLFRLECFARFESRHSQLLNLLGSAKSQIRMRIRRWERRHLTRAPIQPAASRAGHEPGINDRIYMPPLNATWQDAWRVTEAEIEMMHQDVIRHHARFLLVALGTGIQVYPDPAFRARYLKGVGASDILYPDEELARFGERHGFPVLNLVAPMQLYADSHHVFFHGFPNTAMGNGHWNELGNAFAGKLLAKYLCEMSFMQRNPH